MISGQNLFSQQLLIDPHFEIPPALALALAGADGLQGCSQHSSQREIKKKVARGICITKSSLKSDASNVLIVYPPRCKIVLAFFCVQV